MLATVGGILYLVGMRGWLLAFAAVLGFVQEFRAERAMEALQRMAAPMQVPPGTVSSRSQAKPRWRTTASSSWIDSAASTLNKVPKIRPA